MIDFASIINYLLEINGLPTIIDLKKNGGWRSIIEGLNLYSNDNARIESFILNQRIDIFKLLISAPSGISVTKKENQRLIILIIQILDELEFYNDKEYWREYLEFRYKAFDLFVKNDRDVEASEIYRNLLEISSGILGQSELKRRLQNQGKIYRRKINRKIKELENLKQFDKASQLNSMYGAVPNYIYEPEIEEKEKKHFEWHFLEPVYKVIVEVLFFLFVFGINLLVVKNYENGDLFAFFAKGNFTIYDMLFVLVLIFFLFWVFKVLDQLIHKPLWSNIFKGALIILTMVAMEFYVIHKYKVEFGRYFPSEYDKKVMQGEYEDDITRVLVTKFMPLEKTTIFNKDYSDINISQLFYKKMIAQTIEENGKLDSTLLIDYFNDNYAFNERKDMERLYSQGKYDVIISGDFIKEKEKDIKIFTSLYIVNNILLKTVGKMKNLKSHYQPLFKNPLETFLTYYDTPIEYYESICSSLNDKFKININVPSGLNFNVERDFSPELSIVSTLEKSPLICIDYIKIIKLFNSEILCKDDCENISKLIDDILFWNKQGNEVIGLKQKMLILHMYQLKTFVLNQEIALKLNIKHNINNKEIFDNWILKIDYINQSIDLLCEINDIDKFTRNSLIYFNSFINFYNLIDKGDDFSIFSVDSVKGIFNNKLVDLKMKFVKLKNDSVFKILDEDTIITDPYRNIYYYLNNMEL